MNFSFAIAQSLTHALEALYAAESRGASPAVEEREIETPPDPAMGEYAFPCFRLSRDLRAAPAAIAARLREQLLPPSFVERVEHRGGYLNFSVDKERYAALVLEALPRKDAFPPKAETVLVEYSSPNIAKPFHIGHLMTTAIGDALYRAYSRAGYRVVRINHLGDYGTQFGKLICAYRRWGEEEALEKDPIAELLRVYVLFHREAQEDPALDKEARACFLALEQREPAELALWEHFRELSLTAFQRIYDRLGVSFDSTAGESFYTGKMPAAVEKLRQLGLLEESDGAQVVRLEGDEGGGLPPCIILKSDGGTIYATRDIAAALYRQETYHFDRCLYVVGQPQALHFQQVFRVLRRMGCGWADRCTHVGYAHVRFADGRLSTRSGNIVKLEDVLDEGVRLARERLCVERVGMENLDSAAEVIGVGAVKFAFLKNSRDRDVLFNWDEVMDFEGESAPYIQYTYARCRSILRRKKVASPPESAPPTTEGMHGGEFAVVRALEGRDRAILETVERNAPSVLARYACDLARAYNHFYSACPVIGSPRESFRLALTGAVAEVIADCLSLLGIGVVERM